MYYAYVIVSFSEKVYVFRCASVYLSLNGETRGDDWVFFRLPISRMRPNFYIVYQLYINALPLNSNPLRSLSCSNVLILVCSVGHYNPRIDALHRWNRCYSATSCRMPPTVYSYYTLYMWLLSTKYYNHMVRGSLVLIRLLNTYRLHM